MGVELSGYDVTGLIGTGAGSNIYRALDMRTGDVVAIKQVPRKSSNDDRFVAQAESEFEISNKMDHDSLRRSISIHRVKKLLQLRELLVVMEYVDGVSLENARPNRLNSFLALFQRIAAGLHAMHKAGFLHTDIKPSNIMIAKGGVIKIIDFGQACPIHHRKVRIQGTPDYIAPEQVKKFPLDQRTDVFNLGATMYWVLTSEKYPTALRGAEAGMTLTSPDKPLAPIELNDKIPIALSKLIMECCTETPADRPADMEQVIARLAVTQKLWNKHREEARAKRSAMPPDANGNGNENPS